MSKLVSLTYLNDYNITMLENAVKDAVASLGVANFVKPKMKVLLKVCLPNPVSPDSAETTHPAIVSALANWINEMGAECIVADSPYKAYTLTNLEKVYLNTGMLDAANQSKCELNKNLSTFEIETPNGVKSKSLTLLNIINEVDVIINVGKLKIDKTLGFMGASANLFGFVPGEMKTQILNRIQTHRDFHDYILDIYSVLKNKILFNVVDGIVAKESDGNPRLMYCLAVADNMFSLDATLVDMLDIGYKNTILRQAKCRGLFDFDKGYKTIGDKIDKFKKEDFVLHEFFETSPIHKNKFAKTKYFNAHQQRTKIDSNKCKGCGVCSKICPTNAISMKTDKNGELYASIDYSKCIFCNKCHTACPYSVVEKVLPQGHKKLAKELEKHNENTDEEVG